MNPDDPWSALDIQRMSIEEYAKYREYLMQHVRNMTSEEAREALTIPKPTPRFHFEGF